MSPSVEGLFLPAIDDPALEEPPQEVLPYLYDAHCHPTDSAVHEGYDYDQGVPLSCIMATHQEDQVRVERLAAKWPHRIIPAFGPYFPTDPSEAVQVEYLYQDGIHGGHITFPCVKTTGLTSTKFSTTLRYCYQILTTRPMLERRMSYSQL